MLRKAYFFELNRLLFDIFLLSINMKVKYFVLAFFISLTFSSYAQIIHQDTLSAHVHYLTSAELEGRALGTKGKDLATAYILQRADISGSRMGIQYWFWCQL
jgi:hypothetical protein